MSIDKRCIYRQSVPVSTEVRNAALEAARASLSEEQRRVLDRMAYGLINSVKERNSHISLSFEGALEVIFKASRYVHA